VKKKLKIGQYLAMIWTKTTSEVFLNASLFAINSYDRTVYT